MKKLIFLFCLATTLFAQKVDLVVFSYDRPMQLYALLESAEIHASGIEQIVVLYRVSAHNFDIAYQTLKDRFPEIVFVKENPKHPEKNFSPLLMEILKTMCLSPYLMFSTDDIIVKDQVDLEECVALMETYQADGFHLRLGKNINITYKRNQKVDPPPFQNIASNVLLWNYQEGMKCWRYSNTVDCTLYRKDKVLKDLQNILFMNPNTLERNWARIRDFSLLGMCYENSKTVNIPLNLVNETTINPHSNLYTAAQLLKRFNKGLKINIMDLYHIDNHSPHIDYEIKFIPR